MGTKNLKVNGLLLAKYENTDTDLWIKPMLYFHNVDPDMAVHIFALLISEVEKKNFTNIGQLMDKTDKHKN